MEDLIMLAFKIISDGGDASAKFLTAIQNAEDGDFESAENNLKEGQASLVLAHKIQFDLLQKEVSGETTEYSLLMVHAQDHLMNAILLKDLAHSIVRLNKKVAELSFK